MVVSVDGEQKTVTGVGSVRAMLEALQLDPEIVIVIRDRAVLAPEDPVSEADEIRVVRIVAGG
jgi:thiamine biosynthesis protein ThiS